MGVPDWDKLAASFHDTVNAARDAVEQGHVRRAVEDSIRGTADVAKGVIERGDIQKVLHGSVHGSINVVKGVAEQVDIEALSNSLQGGLESAKEAVRKGYSHQVVEDALQDTARSIREAIEKGDVQRALEKFTTKDVPFAAEQAKIWAEQNPEMALCIVVGFTLVLAPGLVTGPALGISGFGAEGVAGGSIAAGVQAGIGDVAAGSLFSVLQSAGAGGAGLAAVNGVIQGAGSAIVAARVGAWLAEQGKMDQSEERIEGVKVFEKDGENTAEKPNASPSELFKAKL